MGLMAVAISNLEEICSNAIGVSVHEDYKKTNRIDNVDVLVSLLKVNNQYYPIKLTVKEYTNKENKLYVVITLSEIKIDTRIAKGSLLETKYPFHPVSTISILELVENININDKEILKYLTIGIFLFLR